MFVLFSFAEQPRKVNSRLCFVLPRSTQRASGCLWRSLLHHSMIQIIKWSNQVVVIADPRLAPRHPACYLTSMSEQGQTYVVGDIHAEWGLFNTFLNTRRPKTVFACGDFGFWPREEQYDIQRLKNKDTKIHWCDGNHENHWALRDRGSDEIHPNVFYQPRGSLLTLPDGRTILFFGGAHSIDKDRRTFGRDWFPEEVPSYADFGQLDKIKTRVDIVVSHTCPNEFEVEKHQWLCKGAIAQKVNDPTRDLLSCVLDMFRPSLWYFGHWHVPMRGEHNGTHWRALNMCPEQGWWLKLE